MREKYVFGYISICVVVVGKFGWNLRPIGLDSFSFIPLTCNWCYVLRLPRSLSPSHAFVYLYFNIFIYTHINVYESCKLVCLFWAYAFECAHLSRSTSNSVLKAVSILPPTELQKALLTQDKNIISTNRPFLAYSEEEKEKKNTPRTYIHLLAYSHTIPNQTKVCMIETEGKMKRKKSEEVRWGEVRRGDGQRVPKERFQKLYKTNENINRYYA